MSDENKNRSNTKESEELFVIEAASFDRIYHNIDADAEPKSIIFKAGSPVDRAESLEELKDSFMNLENSKQEKSKKKEIK
uniref:Uncharacterized protein n=1 Tax=Caenorhabditis tropicalis TaxID=1561998 RepID=A0A1I7UXT3_9PELO